MCRPRYGFVLLMQRYAPENFSFHPLQPLRHQIKNVCVGSEADIPFRHGLATGLAAQASTAAYVN